MFDREESGSLLHDMTTMTGSDEILAEEKLLNEAAHVGQTAPQSRADKVKIVIYRGKELKRTDC